MKKIYVRAFCQSNLGDDLFVLQLAKRYPDTNFYVYALGEHQRAFLGQQNIILPTSGDRVLRKLTHTLHLSRKEAFDGQGLDGTVVIGGSIFWEGADLSFGQENGPCYIIGANCETGYSAEFSNRLRKTLSSVSDCCFRDRFSAALFADVSSVRCAPDVLYDWRPRQVLQKGEGIGISVVGAKGCFRDEQAREGYYGAIAGLCDLCISRGIPVRLLGFCAVEGDGEALKAIAGRTAHPEKIQSILYAGNPERMLYELNRCETVLATRFHAMILGWVLGKNVVPVIYNEKQTHILEDVGFEGPVWNALAGETKDGQALLEDCLLDAGRLDIGDLRRDAAQQFMGLDQFLVP